MTDIRHDISEIEIVEQEQDNYVMFKFTLDGKKSNVEISIGDLLNVLHNYGWWFDAPKKGEMGFDDPQKYEDYVKEKLK